MSAIKTKHDLEEIPGAVADIRERSDYCYLFTDPANAEDSGRFCGTDDQTTIARLKEFEVCYRQKLGASPPPALSISLPAAYTYFGQFMNHDISAPIGGLLVNVGDIPSGIIGTADLAGLGKTYRGNVEKILEHFVNEHANPLTLESLYGDGPKSGDEDVKALFNADGKRFCLGTTVTSDRSFFTDNKINPQAVTHARDAAGNPAPDILRKDGKPLIADLRNDGNLILCQLHLAFMLVHNKAVAALEKGRPPGEMERALPPGEDIFAKARQLVTLHYHWLILHDFLPSLLSRTVLPLSRWVPRETGPHPRPEVAAVPMEFTSAAFRFGHSMVGGNYDFNANFGEGGAMESSATFGDLFNFTSAGNMGHPGADALPLPDHWVIDWDRMTRPAPAGAAGARRAGGAEQIDMAFAPDMLDSAGDATRVAEHGSIMFRNLLRGFHRRIPFGQRLAEACGITPLGKDQLRAAMAVDTPDSPDASDIAAAADRLGILDETPAWLYFLCEAKALEKGERLGPTASQIIADTIVGLMRRNRASVLNHQGGTWEPGQSALKARDGTPLNSLRAFLMFATEPEPG